MEHNFQPLLFGGDINVYSVARAFHEAYGIQLCLPMASSPPARAYGSTIIDYRVCPENEDAAAFLRQRGRRSPRSLRTRPCWSSAAATAM